MNPGAGDVDLNRDSELCLDNSGKQGSVPGLRCPCWELRVDDVMQRTWGRGQTKASLEGLGPDGCTAE